MSAWSVPHYDTFAEFQYAYHYGDIHSPYIRQDEPLKVECGHFLDCIRHGRRPLTSGEDGLKIVRILEAASRSLEAQGGPVDLETAHTGGAAPRLQGAPVLAAPARDL